MEAGRELDTEIAASIMGLIACPDWKIVNFGSAGGPAVQSKCSHAAGTCYSLVETGSMFGTVGGCPRYSTDIVAAWTVVEHLMATLDGAIFSLISAHGEWEAGFGYWAPGEQWIAHDSAPQTVDTAPLAICLAALATVDT